MIYSVYIIRCGDGNFYTGITTHVERRIAQHNGERAGGAKYTYVRRPVQLAYEEKCISRSEALKREYVIKQMSRSEKVQLVQAFKAQI